MSVVDKPTTVTPVAPVPEAATAVRPPLPSGPASGVEYPLKVLYCGVCSLPTEYCENWGTFDKCRAWLESHLPDEFARLTAGEGKSGDGDDKPKGRQKRGGKGLVKTKKKGTQRIEMFRSNRGKKKFITVVRGLATYEIDVKDAAKAFASKFACGSSMTAPDEIVIQGDVKDDLYDLILEKWPEVDEDSIDDLGDKKY
jgi:density-regulated protein DRP1